MTVKTAFSAPSTYTVIATNDVYEISHEVSESPGVDDLFVVTCEGLARGWFFFSQVEAERFAQARFPQAQ